MAEIRYIHKESFRAKFSLRKGARSRKQTVKNVNSEHAANDD